jgi:hypothetical protein
MRQRHILYEEHTTARVKTAVLNATGQRVLIDNFFRSVAAFTPTLWMTESRQQEVQSKFDGTPMFVRLVTPDEYTFDGYEVEFEEIIQKDAAALGGLRRIIRVDGVEVSNAPYWGVGTKNT